MNTLMNNRFPSLVTSSVAAGITLAGELADELHAQFEAGNDRVARPGGTNLLVKAPASREAIAAVLFYAISAANHGWPKPQA